MTQRKKPKPKPQAAKTDTPWLHEFGVHDTTHPLVKVMRVKDSTGKVMLASLSPDGLSEVLLELLELAGTWSEFSPKIQPADGPTRALPASHIAINKGREPTEAAITMHVGPTQLVFLLPVQVLLPEMARLARRLGRMPDGGGPLQ